MGTIWLLVLIIVGSDGTVKTDVRWANNPEYNTEQLCNAAGKTLADDLLSQIGSDNGAVFWKCQEASIDEMLKGAGKSVPKANGTEL